MSSRKRSIVFSPHAQEDIDDILAYTLDKWGERQVAQYKKALDKAFSLIIRNPKIGRVSDDFSNARIFSVGRHLIFYRGENTGVFVIRILHERMDSLGHLEQ